jgi:hypothetical protein
MHPSKEILVYLTTHLIFKMKTSPILLAILPTLLFLSLITMAQTPFNYDAAWKKVEAAFNQGKPKTAIEEIDKIYAQAKRDKNEAFQVKAIIFKSEAIQQVEEDSWLQNIKTFEQEIVQAQEPVKQILFSVSADLYHNYFQNQRWKIYDRTSTNDTDPNNPETWSITDFNDKISSYYSKSLTNPALLQKTALTKYDPIITKGNVRHLRPTLFDLLAHKALEYWSNDESEITKPVYAFVLNDYSSLAAAKMFIRTKFESKDSTSNILKAIKLYQDLIRFHLEDEKPDALIDVDIARVSFANENGVLEGKNQFYKEALEHIYVQYGKNQQAMQAGYLLANWWRNKADNYNPQTGTSEDKMAYAIALDYAEQVFKAFPKSEGGLNAKVLMEEIKKPSIGLQVEKGNVINKPFRALLSFKTVSQVFFRIVKLPSGYDEENAYYENEDTYWSRVTDLAPIKTWKQKVPDFKDYRQHSAEMKIDALPNGRYLLIASTNEAFTLDKNPLAAAELHVSNISYVQTGEHYFVLHRDNGQPLHDAKVQVWYSQYDYNKRRNILNKGELYTTNKNGYVRMKPVTDGRRTNGDMRLEITTKTDYLFLNDAAPRVYAGNKPADKTKETYEIDNARYYFFTDRSIYRPGQTLYFKAIGLTADAQTGKAKLYKPAMVEVILRNANYEQVASAKFTPNEFASINGNFLLPSSGLTGTFQLEIKMPNRSWQQSVRVEEYKRPKFFVEYPPIKGTYKLNNEVVVKGVAKGYAGNTIDGAQVTYRVTRSTRFLYPWRFGYGRGGYWPPMGRGETMEITNGTTLTKADGSFEISFTALPDLSIDKNLDPSFNFTIEADVTDLNGETRSAETQVNVGYKALVLSLNTGGNLMRSADSTFTVSASTTNFNGEPEATSVKLKIFALNNPGRLMRKRYWEAPDTFLLNRTEFEKLFPNDPYANEDNFRNWEDGKLISSNTLQTPQANHAIKPGTLAPGYYRMEATATDKDGQEVKSVEYVAIFDTKKQQLPEQSYVFDYAQRPTIEPGEQATWWHGSSVPNAFMIQQIQKKGMGGMNYQNESISTFEYLNLKEGIKPFSFKATEEDRGGYMVNRVMVYNNRVYTQNWMVNVPWSNKALNISFQTFRDKLKPGDEETWTVKISGAKGEQAAAELLAGMYDASLDQFAPHYWQNISPWNNNTFYGNWNDNGNFRTAIARVKSWYVSRDYFDKRYDNLLTVAGYGGRRMMMAKSMRMEDGAVLNEVISPATMGQLESIQEGKIGYINQSGTKDIGIVAPPPPPNAVEKKEEFEKNNDIQIRKNFNETAFFFPDLKTDAEGNISFSFTMPEALTQWKLQLLGHTTDARFAYATRNVVTQKQLMVLPNPPRFFRQGDNMEFSVKISNLSDKELTGQATLEMINAATMQPVDGWFKNVFPNQYFTVGAGQSTALKFPIETPYLYNDAVMYRVVAKAGDFSDGEEMALPVLTNRMLVTESFPLNLRGTNSKTFNWQRFKDLTADAQKTVGVDNHSLTVEYTTNPAWYAIQALPYLMEYPYDCAEQTWNRFYANALASNIANSAPRIKEIFESWKAVSPDALMSNLQKNQELKSALLEETPWVLDAKNEAEQKRNLGLLFDLVRMNNEATASMNKLQELQSPNGGFVWFKGGRDDRFMTQYILTGIGHLMRLDAWPTGQRENLLEIINKGLPYADARIKDEYDELMKSKPDMKLMQLSSFAIQYLYMRSFFPEYRVATASQKAYDFYLGQATKFWPKVGKYQQGMIALALHRHKADNVTAKDILKSLTENSISHEEFGMYWKEFNNPGYYWWQAPIESHALLMEAYHEIENNTQRVDDLKTWLLKQKQTTNWKTTKATAEACYALLLRGTDWLSEERSVNIDLGGYTLSSANNDKTEAGTGYFKQVVPREKIKPEMGNIKVQIETKNRDKTQVSSSTSWGAIYWQYFEDLDRITPAETGVAIKKELYIQRNSERGPVLELLKEGDFLKVGDKVKVRVEIKNDRQLEYVHLKDMRASCFEPVNVLSSYKYQGGLGYYEATRDASSNFFIGYLPRGTWVFEYELRTTHTGEFSNGITTLQSMYAPEFSSHSKGVRVKVE